MMQGQCIGPDEHGGQEALEPHLAAMDGRIGRSCASLVVHNRVSKSNTDRSFHCGCMPFSPPIGCGIANRPWTTR